MMRPTRDVIACLLLAAGTLLTYTGTFRNGFVGFDDNSYVTDNPYVLQGLSPAGIVYAFTTFQTGNWIPLTWLSLELDATLFGTRAAGFHATSLVLHITNVLLLFVLLRRLTEAFWRSAVVAALFAVHPLHVESVAWIAERKDVLSMFWFLVMLLAYERYARRLDWARYLGVTAAFALGLLSKSMLVTAPVLLLLLDYWPLRRILYEQPQDEPASRYPPQSMQALLREKLPLLALSLVCGLVTIAAQRDSSAMTGLGSLPLEIRMGNAVVAYAWYVVKTFVPTGLCVVYAHPLMHLNWVAVAGSALFLFAVTVLIVQASAARPWLLWGWLWFFVSLLPVIGLLQVGVQAYADRYTYLPHLGLLTLIVWESTYWLGKLRHGDTLARALSGLAVLVYAVLTVVQITYWKDFSTMWQRALAVDGNNWFGNFQVGSQLLLEGQLETAEEHLQKALKGRSNYDLALANLAWIRQRQGDLPAAQQLYGQALQANPKYLNAWYSVALVLKQQGDKASAIQCLLQCVELEPDNLEVRNQLGLLYAQQGQMKEALQQFLMAVKINPQSGAAHNNAALAYAELKQPADAARHLEEALRINPRDANAHVNLAVLLENAGRFQEAKTHYAAAVAEKPEDEEAAAGLKRTEEQLPAKPET